MKTMLTEAKLQQRWGALLDAGTPITNAQTRKVLAQVFENTFNEFKNKGLIVEDYDATKGGDRPAPGQRSNIMGTRRDNGFMTGPDSYAAPNYKPMTARSGENDFFMPNVVMPMLRRIFPDLIANELVGVQPMNGPVGIALALRAQYNQDAWNAGILGDGTFALSDEIGFDSPVVKYTGVSADALSGELSDFYTLSGEVNGEAATAGEDRETRWAGQGADVNASSEFASFKNGSFPTASFGLMKATVEAKTRKIGGRWSPELAEDMQAVHGIDVENEMVNILSYEIGAEIDRQILVEMVKAAITGGSKSTWMPSQADGNDQMGRLATLLTLITIEANNIALKTRRGAGNFVVASPRVCALLEQLGMNKYIASTSSKKIPTVPYSGVGALQKQGLINDGNQLLVRDAQSMADYVLIGYKGSHPGDSGIIYCPYIPVQMQKAIDPDTLTPVVGCRTRYGLMNSVWDARRYYHFISVKGLFSAYSLTETGRYFLGTNTDSILASKDMYPR